MVNNTLFESLPGLIASIGRQRFYPQIIRSLNAIESIANTRVVSYPKAKRPVFLGLDTLNEVDQIYCESAYLLDPVYEVICRRTPDDWLTLDSLISNNFESSTYYHRFYRRLGWKNETNIVVDTHSNNTICIVYTTDNRSPQLVRRVLTPYLQSLKSAIQTHERLYHPEPIVNAPSCTEAQEDYENPLEMYGLTKREKQIVTLILEGLPSQAIADRCFVSEGTIKNHRKNIYRKLCIRSQGELFRKFMH